MQVLQESQHPDADVRKKAEDFIQKKLTNDGEICELLTYSHFLFFLLLLSE